VREREGERERERETAYNKKTKKHAKDNINKTLYKIKILVIYVKYLVRIFIVSFNLKQNIR